MYSWERGEREVLVWNGSYKAHRPVHRLEHSLVLTESSLRARNARPLAVWMPGTLRKEGGEDKVGPVQNPGGVTARDSHVLVWIFAKYGEN